MTVSIPGWALGTFFGVIMGNILPPSLVSALSVGIYGMFLAIIIPPARKSKIILGKFLKSPPPRYSTDCQRVIQLLK